MSEMVDAVALAICRSDQEAVDWPLSKSIDDILLPKIYRRQARAAIAAMREPTKAMLNETGWQVGRCMSPDHEAIALEERGAAQVLWSAMIDSALA